MLRGGDAPVAEHFRDAFDRHSVAEGDGGGKRVASNVEGEVLRYVALRCYLLKGIVEVLVAGDRKNGLSRIGRGNVGM